MEEGGRMFQLIFVVLVCLIGTLFAFLAGWSLGSTWRGIDGRRRVLRRGSVVILDEADRP